MGAVLIDQRLSELAVETSDLESVRLQPVAAAPVLAQRLSLRDDAPDRLLEALDPLWGP